MMKLLCFALFACAFNLLLGFTGLLSFGHAAFFGTPAYVTGWLIKRAGLAAGARRRSPASRSRRCSAWSSASIAIRRQGIYFAMITLALAQMVYFVCLQAPFTGGEDGLQGVPRGKLFGVRRRWRRRHRRMYYVVLGDLRRRASWSSCASCTRPSARC